MKQDTARPPDGHGHHIAADLLAGLWEDAPFARLPLDAPSELKEFVEDIENPKRVYAIHRASRRHGFQQLVEKFIVQLREGCGSKSCTTTTCFTCRKHSVGRVPIRRYNITSARILAVYMASQDNPENALCPALRTPKAPPAAVESLLFYRKPPIQYGEDRSSQSLKSQHGLVRGGSLKGRPVSAKSPYPLDTPRTTEKKSHEKAGKENSPRLSQESPVAPQSAEFQVSEKHVGKDYRSFAANVFGTVAFKMLEWLTPNALEDMHGTLRELQGESVSDEEIHGLPKTVRRKSSPRPKSPPPDAPLRQAKESHNEANEFSITEEASSSTTSGSSNSDLGDREKTRQTQANGQPPVYPRPGTPRRNSNARVRTNSAAKHKRQLSIDTYPPETSPDEGLGGLRSPRYSTDKTTRSLKNSASALSRPIAQIPTAGFFDAVPLEKIPPPKATEIKPKLGCGQVDGLQSSGNSSPKKQDNPRTPSEQSQAESSLDASQSDSDTSLDRHLPQTVMRLNTNIVDFLCDVLQDDGTSESHLFEPAAVTKFYTRSTIQHKSMRRRAKGNASHAPNMKLEWKLFVEQSLFYVLSEPHALIRSFTKKGQLYDSQTLWYCMLRMTRVAPSLVFHSLWLAAADLFAPPKSVQSMRSPTARLFPKQDRTLSNAEAGMLMSICLHALVAAAPVVGEQRQLLDMSRIRSQGLCLAGSGAVARQPAELCLSYDDAFSNDLTMRLARRLLAAITTRRYFNEMLQNESALEDDDDSKNELDILSPIFAQLDFLNVDAAYVLEFSLHDRALHETRMPTLLLDWARAVMLHEWDGGPEVAGDGPFGGALALIEAIYQKRHHLLIADNQFLSEYFAERLDDIEMPAAWLSFTSTKQSLHLLDFPYIFSPDKLVSYFRAINFQRMNRAHEAASSIKNQMDRLFDAGTLIVNPHHKSVLQDMLRTASSKYLVLDIGRRTVIRDAFDQLWRREERELLRPLKVHLGEDDGEEGFDSGGVQQEFFRLAVAEALNPDYGAFTVDERTHMTWFQPGSIETEWKFELVGLLISLAVYNGLTLPVTFPRALYRKLLGEPVTELNHIEDGWPDLANGLNTLLEWNEEDGKVEDIFARTYEFSVELFNTPISREMHSTTPGTQPDPEEWPQFSKYPSHVAGYGGASSSLAADNPPDAPMVCNSNRNAYVSDYIRYLTDVSVRPQYEAFARGFRSVLHPKSLTLLSPSLLQKIVEGVQEIDISELRRAVKYVSWDASHRTVKDFWSIVRKYDDRMKRKLLEFVTASDRVPVGGIKNIQFIIQKNGEYEGADGRLPTAYTCYGTLLLPEYKDKEVLRERLSMALENAQGFGFP